jgi:hypothetical protein
MDTFAGLFQIFSFENKTDLTSGVGVFGEFKSWRHYRLANTNAVELAKSKLFAKAMHSARRDHWFYYSIDDTRREYQFTTPIVLYSVARRFHVKLCG